MAKVSRVPRIYVLAGTNGAGKSSLMGTMLLQRGVQHFDPDQAAQPILSANLHTSHAGISQVEANSAAWHQGKRLLERAISEKFDFAFETTLGGKTIVNLLDKALLEGIEVRIWYVGLDSVERHIARVRSRVVQGGHDIPEERIRERYIQSRLNLIRLLPRLTELLLYDNSEEADPRTGTAPEPSVVLSLVRGKVRQTCELTRAPEWAKPILAVALKLNPKN
ncbi:MAG TPA: zeta toxin family protein [Terriglobales bacterium]|nr:zeta toxin family protein [Terriglobales bacterium]